jgi:hypothetical protein
MTREAHLAMSRMRRYRALQEMTVVGTVNLKAGFKSASSAAKEVALKREMFK